MGLTRQQSIDAFCKQCIYDPWSGDGTWRQQVEKCTSLACPLYNFRPLSIQTVKDQADPEKSELARKRRGNFGRTAN